MPLQKTPVPDSLRPMFIQLFRSAVKNLWTQCPIALTTINAGTDDEEFVSPTADLLFKAYLCGCISNSAAGLCPCQRDAKTRLSAD